MPLFPWSRQSEVMKQAETILAECCRQLAMGEKVFGKSAKEWVAKRKWSDDQSEMKRLIYYAALTAKGREIEAVHFPPIRRKDHEAFTKRSFQEMALEEAVKHKVGHFFERLGEVEVTDVYPAVIMQVEKPLIELSLKWAGGNQQKAARVLGINRNTLHSKMVKLGIKT